MKIFKRIVLALVVIFVLIQVYRPTRDNPPVDQSKTMEQTMHLAPAVATTLSRACNDCHSSKTVWPWYTNVAPISWILSEHVKDGRRELNMSEWGTYTDKKKRRKLQEICEQVNKKEMPLPSYLWIHHDAALSDADRTLLCDWANAEKAKFPAPPPAAAGSRK